MPGLAGRGEDREIYSNFLRSGHKFGISLKLLAAAYVRLSFSRVREIFYQ
jgi:hypothetical protein